jgi:hypothetical protein
MSQLLDGIEELATIIRQYLQLVPPRRLRWPRSELLRAAPSQQRLFDGMFNETKVQWMPPERYQLLVLKTLVSKILDAISDPEKEVGFDYSVLDQFRYFCSKCTA